MRWTEDGKTTNEITAQHGQRAWFWPWRKGKGGPHCDLSHGPIQTPPLPFITIDLLETKLQAELVILGRGGSLGIMVVDGDEVRF